MHKTVLPFLASLQVVLPHPKQADKDVVLFLDEADAAPSENEAHQRAAVMALHHLAGDRSLERTLPPQYVAQWTTLGRAAQERQARSAAAAERRAAQQAKQQAALKRRGPSTVIMTEDNRRMVEGIIAELRGEGAGQDGGAGVEGWESFGRPDATSAGPATLEAAPALVDDLIVLGFGREDAARAVQLVGGTQGAELSAALDWLCLNVPEDRLPSNFAPGAAGKPMTVLLRGGNSTAGHRGSAGSLPPSVNIDAMEGSVGADQDPAVAELMQYGYPPFLCMDALQSSQGHLHDALRLLWRRLLRAEQAPAEDGNSTDAGAGNESDLTEWGEEREALEAIYAEDATFHSASWTSIKLTVILDGQAAEVAAKHGSRPKEALMVDGVEVILEAWAPKEGSYPTVVPTLAVRSSDVPPVVLLAVTQRIAQTAVGLLGHPMLYEVATTVAEVLPECLLHTPSLEALLGGADGDDVAEGMAEQLTLDSEEEEAGSKPETGRTKHQGKERTSRQHRRHAPLDIPAESTRLLQRQKELEVSAKHATMRAQRSKLPAYTKRGEVVSSVAGRAVVVISGATGCGKSTQVPQYILEDAIARGFGAACNIICTQPRRISAIGLASRVAAERGESVGESVGYSVRLDSKQTARTRLLFCTTGILLRRLLSDPSLGGTTHVILDEVHERSIESDLLLLLLRKLLTSGSNPGLRVVLMSATADAELFASYFESSLGRPPTVLTIPGFTHPVTDFFLEDALEATGMVIGRTSKWAKKSAQGKGESAKGSLDDAAAELLGSDRAAAKYSPQTLESLRNVDEALLNYDLIEAMVVHAAQAQRSALHGNGNGTSKPGSAPSAILVFAPGAEEIGRIVRTLQNSPRLAAAAPGGVRALPLHGGLPPSHQARVFDRPPAGVLKVVVSTNVAETSITIDDVVCVIDSGRVKEMRFDPERGIARLQETWVSQASAQQRRGRAGRVQPGTCYRLFSSRTWARMPKDTPPEVARAPLQSLVMDVKGILRDVDAADVLAQMITPPKPAAVAQAILELQRVGALDPGTGALTPLGQHLTRMPCDPRVGKMLIFGAMLRCLDPVLTVAALQGHGRPAFFSPPDRREEASAAKSKLVSSVAASKSDHLAAVAAYNGWRAAVAKGGRSAASDFCSRFFISDQAMDGIHSGRRQYAEILADLGFVPSDYPAAACAPQYSPGTASPGVDGSGGAPSGGAERFTGRGGVDEFAGHARIVKAVLAAGLYPQLLRADHPAAKYQKVLGGAVEAEGEAGKVKFFDREKGEETSGIEKLPSFRLVVPCNRFGQQQA